MREQEEKHRNRILNPKWKRILFAVLVVLALVFVLAVLALFSSPPVLVVFVAVVAAAVLLRRSASATNAVPSVFLTLFVGPVSLLSCFV